MDTWSAPDKLSNIVIRFTALPAGNYNLIAQIYDPLNGWSESDEMFAFTVKAKWWQSSFFKVLFSLGILFLGMLLLPAYDKYKFYRARKLDEKVQLRTTELRYIAEHDELTGLINYRSFWNKTSELIENNDRAQQNLGFFLIDLDYFKKINDNYGHLVGDKALVFAANIIKNVQRDSDIVSRYGGEEFGVFVEGPNSDVLLMLAERICNAFRNSPFEVSPGEEIQITASVGISEWLGASDTAEALFARADAALYKAKETRNTFVLWDPSVSKF